MQALLPLPGGRRPPPGNDGAGDAFGRCLSTESVARKGHESGLVAAWIVGAAWGLGRAF